MHRKKIYPCKSRNIRDIPNVRPERLTSQAVSGQYTYFFYDTDGDNFEDLQIIYMIVSQGYDTDGDQIFSFPRMVLFAKDINRNLRFDKNEKFIVDYTNSQLTNPLLEKKPEPEKKKLSFDGEKKSA